MPPSSGGSDADRASGPVELTEQIEEVRQWIVAITGWTVLVTDAATFPAGPAAGPSGDRMLMCPLQFRAIDLAVGPDVSGLEIRLLVWAQSPDAVAATVVLAELALQAMARGDLDVDVDPDLPTGTDLMRPTLCLKVVHRREIVRPRAAPVRHLLTVKGTGVRRVTGRVVAADGIPLSGAVVRVLPSGRPTATSYDGQFSVSVPAGSPCRLRVSARGFTVDELVDGHDVDQLVEVVLDQLGSDPAVESAVPATVSPTTAGVVVPTPEPEN